MAIKVCINPHCEAVAHNCPKKETRCRDCGMILVEINKECYQSKFALNTFQYDYSNHSGDRITPAQMGYSTQLSLDV